MTGPTGSGKSTLSRAIFLASAAPRLVIDPVDSTTTTIPGAVTFTDPNRATNSRGENWRDAATARFVPDDPDDLDAYDAMFRWVLAQQRPRYVWVDEGGIALPSTKCPPQGKKLLLRGRKLQVGAIVCHTRPIEVNPNAISQARHVLIVGALPHPDDVQRMSGMLGVAPAELRRLLAELTAPHWGPGPARPFLWWERDRRRVTVCPPLRRGGA